MRELMTAVVTVDLRPLMSAGSFALLLISVLLACAGIPALIAYRDQNLYAADVALVLVPTPVFVLAMLAFNEPARTGWALIGYPFPVLALSVAALYFRVLALPKLGFRPRAASRTCLALAVVGAAAFGTFAAPWHE